MDETMAVQLTPLLNELWRERVVIIGEIIGCARIQIRAAILGNQAIEFVGNGKLRCLDVQLVDVMLDGLALRFIGRARQLVIFHRDRVQIDLLGGIIHGAQFIGTLEHDVLKVVCNPGIRTID